MRDRFRRSWLLGKILCHRLHAGLEHVKRIEAARFAVSWKKDRVSAALDRSDNHEIIRQVKTLDAEVRMLCAKLSPHAGFEVFGPWLVWNEADLGLAVAATAYIGLAPTMLGNLFYLYGVAVLGSARAAAFLYLSPLFSAALSIGWLGEQLAWYHIAGIAAIFSGLIILGKSGPACERDRRASELAH
jgi:hypothetical protein